MGIERRRWNWKGLAGSERKQYLNKTLALI